MDLPRRLIQGPDALIRQRGRFQTLAAGCASMLGVAVLLCCVCITKQWLTKC